MAWSRNCAELASVGGTRELQELAEEEPPGQEGRLSWDKWPDFLLCKWAIYF